MESFPPNMLRKDSLSREHFVEHIDGDRAMAKAFAAEKLQKKPDVAIIGDKFPRGYLELDRLARQFPQIAIIVCQRQPGEVFSSWNRRAEDESDANWQRGQIWLFAYLEMLYLASVLAHLDCRNVFILGYEFLVGLDTRDDAAKAIFELFSLSATESVVRFLETSQAVTKTSLARERILDDWPTSILKTPHMQRYRELTLGTRLQPSRLLRSGFAEVVDLLEKDSNDIRKIAREAAIQYRNSPDFVREWLIMRETYSRAFHVPFLERLFAEIDLIVAHEAHHLGWLVSCQQVIRKIMPSYIRRASARLSKNHS